jgi:hypothetical protein
MAGRALRLVAVAWLAINCAWTVWLVRRPVPAVHASPQSGPAGGVASPGPSASDQHYRSVPQAGRPPQLDMCMASLDVKRKALEDMRAELDLVIPLRELFDAGQASPSLTATVATRVQSLPGTAGRVTSACRGEVCRIDLPAMNPPAVDRDVWLRQRVRRWQNDGVGHLYLQWRGEPAADGQQVLSSLMNSLRNSPSVQACAAGNAGGTLTVLLRLPEAADGNADVGRTTFNLSGPLSSDDTGRCVAQQISRAIAELHVAAPVRPATLIGHLSFGGGRGAR